MIPALAENSKPLIFPASQNRYIAVEMGSFLDCGRKMRI